MEKKLEIYFELRELLRISSAMLTELEPVMCELLLKLREAQKGSPTAEEAFALGSIQASAAAAAVVVDQLRKDASTSLCSLYLERAVEDPNLGVRHAGGSENAESTEE